MRPIWRYRLIERPRITAQLLQLPAALTLVTGQAGCGKSVAAAQAMEASRQEGMPTGWIDAADPTVASGGLGPALRHALAGMDASEARPGLLVVDGLDSADGAALAKELGSFLGSHPEVRMIATLRQPADGFLASEHLMGLVALVGEDTLMMTAQETSDLLAGRRPELARGGLASLLHEATGGYPGLLHFGLSAVFANAGEVPQDAMERFYREHVSSVVAGLAPQHAGIVLASALVQVFSPESVAAMTEQPLAEVQQALQPCPGLPTFAAPPAEVRFAKVLAAEGLAAKDARWRRYYPWTLAALRQLASQCWNPEQLRRMQARGAEMLASTHPRGAMAAAHEAGDWQRLAAIAGQAPPPLNPAQASGAPRLSDIPESARTQSDILDAYALIDEFARPRGRAGLVLNGFKRLAERGTHLGDGEGVAGITATFLRMVAARLSGSHRSAERLVAQAERKLAHANERELPRGSRIFAAGVAQLAITDVFLGDLDAAEDSLDLAPAELLHGAGASPHLASLRALIAALRGELPAVRSALEACEQIAEDPGWKNEYVGAGYRLAGALLALEQGNPDEADLQLAALAAHEKTIEYWPWMAMCRAEAEAQRHGPEPALAVLDREAKRRRGRFRLMPAVRDELAAHRAQLLWLLGRPMHLGANSQHPRVQALAALRAGRAEHAIRFASQQAVQCASGGQSRERAQALLLAAAAAEHSGDRTTAQRSVTEAAQLLQHHELSLPLRRMPASVLENLAKHSPLLLPRLGVAGTAHATELLSPAELRALKAVIAAPGVPGAAEALFLSRQTVRSHLKRVYRKLGVHSLDEAARAAASLGLLDEQPEHLPSEEA